jgi:hypothetical protein
VAAAVGNIMEGFGMFRGYEGNFTLCGDLAPDQGFLGHIVIRVVDPNGNLRTQAELPLLRRDQMQTQTRLSLRGLAKKARVRIKRIGLASRRMDGREV